MSYSVRLAGWAKGVDNVHADMEMPADALRAASNVDIFDSGKLRRRRGSTRVVPLVGAHSFWSHKDLALSYYVAGTTLYSITKALVSTAVVTGLMNGATVAYCNVNGEVFWSNGHVTGRILNGVNRPWGLESPSTSPTLTRVAGTLPAGTYQVTTSFRNAAGEESGAPNAVSITVPANSGIQVSGLIAPVDASITARTIYVTGAGDEVLYRVAAISPATGSYTITSTATSTSALRTLGLDPMPAGTLIAHRNGVLYVAVGPVVYHSEPMRFGLSAVDKMFYMYPADVTVLMAVPEGLHVCADKSYFLSDPATPDVVQTTTLPFGAVKGTGIHLPNGNDVAWFSPRGQVIASGASVSLVTDKQYAPGLATTGVSFAREQQGLRQIVTVTHQNDINSLTYTGA